MKITSELNLSIGLPENWKGKMEIGELETRLTTRLHQDGIESDDSKGILRELKRLGNPYFDSHTILYYTPRYGSKGDHRNGWISRSLFQRIIQGLRELEMDSDLDSISTIGTTSQDSENLSENPSENQD